MNHDETLTRLHFAKSGIWQLAAGSAQSQLDMRTVRPHRKTGKYAKAGPIERLDSLAVALAAPYMQALADVEEFLIAGTPAKD